MIQVKKENSVLKNIVSLIVRNRKEAAIILIMALFTVAVTVALPLINRDLIDNGLIKQDFNRIIAVSILLFILNLLSQLFSYIQFIESNKMNNKIFYRLYYKAYRHTLHMKTLDLGKGNYNQIVRQFELDINNIQKLTESYIISVMTECLKIIGALVGLSFISMKLTFVVIAFIPVKVVSTSYFAKLNDKYVNIWLKSEQKFGFWLGDSLSGINEIKLWAIYGKKLYELKSLMKNVLVSKFGFYNIAQLNSFSEVAAHSLILHIILFIYGSYLVLGNKISIGSLFSFTSYASLVLGPISYLINIKMEIAAVKPSMERYLDFVCGDTEDRKDPGKPKKTFLDQDIYSIKFKNVSFEIEGKKILRDINFEIGKGDSVAIVGLNGSGKSTLINLLLRFYEPSKGVITINDININKLDLDAYRLLYGVMMQKSFLFNDTIRNNITMYSQYYNDDCLTEVCSLIGAMDFINRLDQGYDSVVGNDGAALSGGEKQKIAVARVLLKPSKVIILDEATSNFDRRSEHLLDQLITANGSFDMAIIISHRIEVLKRANKILFLEEGKIAAYGSYQHLLKCEKFIDFMNSKEEV